MDGGQPLAMAVVAGCHGNNDAGGGDTRRLDPPLLEDHARDP